MNTIEIDVDLTVRALDIGCGSESSEPRIYSRVSYQRDGKLVVE